MSRKPKFEVVLPLPLDCGVLISFVRILNGKVINTSTHIYRGTKGWVSVQIDRSMDGCISAWLLNHIFNGFNFQVEICFPTPTPEERGNFPQNDKPTCHKSGKSADFGQLVLQNLGDLKPAPHSGNYQ